VGGSAFTISVLMCVYNIETYIRKCINALLNQTIEDFEIVIVDDGSTDNTLNIIENFDDKRIRCFRNQKNIGVAKSRNKCIKLSRGENLFFTDGDCIVSKNWIEEGFKFIKEKGCVGVEGKTCYVAEGYQPTFSDDVIQNEKPRKFMTCNMAYKKSVIERIRGFDERYTYNSDRDLALKAMKLGRICFNPNMIVYHQKRTVKPLQFVGRGKRIRSRVLLYKKFGERELVLWRIVYPLHLMGMFFPPLIFSSFFRNRYKTKEDFALFPFIYIRLLYERLNLWNMCAKERVFLI